MKRLLRESGLNTVCQEARCPNRSECWGSGTATFLLLGDTCTRACRFCSVIHSGGDLGPPDPFEAAGVVGTARALGLRHVVLTSVTRDDLPDGGASHYRQVIAAVREALPGATVETLVPPLGHEALATVLGAGVDVLAHNLEVVRRLTPLVRDRRADYDESLRVLRDALATDPRTRTKSSLLLGLGETRDEVLESLDDMRLAGVSIVALGQYLQPTRRQIPVVSYITPEAWAGIECEAKSRGFAHVAAGPFVRTSFKAHEALEASPRGNGP